MWFNQSLIPPKIGCKPDWGGWARNWWGFKQRNCQKRAGGLVHVATTNCYTTSVDPKVLNSDRFCFRGPKQQLGHLYDHPQSGEYLMISQISSINLQVWIVCNKFRTEVNAVFFFLLWPFGPSQPAAIRYRHHPLAMTHFCWTPTDQLGTSFGSKGSNPKTFFFN